MDLFTKQQLKANKNLIDYLGSCTVHELNILSDHNDALKLCYLQGGLRATEFLLNTPDNPTTMNIRFHTLIWAAQFGLLDLLDRLLHIPTVLTRANDGIGEENINALGYAAEGGLLAIVDRLLQEPIVAEHADHEDNEALVMAASNGHTAVVERLLQESVVRERAHINDNRALRAATARPYWDIIDLLMAVLAVREAAKHEADLIVALASTGDVSAMNDILAKKNVRLFTSDLAHSVDRAAFNKHTPMLNRLLELADCRPAHEYMNHSWANPACERSFQTALKRALWVSLQAEVGFETIDTISHFEKFMESFFQRNRYWMGTLTARYSVILIKSLKTQILSLAYINPFIGVPNFKFGYSPYNRLPKPLKVKTELLVSLPDELIHFEEVELRPSRDLAQRCLMSWSRECQAKRVTQAQSTSVSSEVNLSKLRIG